MWMAGNTLSPPLDTENLVSMLNRVEEEGNDEDSMEEEEETNDNQVFESQKALCTHFRKSLYFPPTWHADVDKNTDEETNDDQLLTNDCCCLDSLSMAANEVAARLFDLHNDSRKPRENDEDDRLSNVVDVNQGAKSKPKILERHTSIEGDKCQETDDSDMDVTSIKEKSRSKKRKMAVERKKRNKKRKRSKRVADIENGACHLSSEACRASRISRIAHASPTTLIIALVYLQRLKASNKEFIRSEIKPSNLFLISMMVASKFIHDDGEAEDVLASDWAQAGMISKGRLHQLELQFLNAIDYRLIVSNEEFEEVRIALEKTVLNQQVNRREPHYWLSYSEIEVVLQGVNTLKLFWDQLALGTIKVTLMCLTAYLASASAALLAMHSAKPVSDQVNNNIADPVTLDSCQSSSSALLDEIGNDLPIKRNSVGIPLARSPLMAHSKYQCDKLPTSSIQSWRPRMMSASLSRTMDVLSERMGYRPDSSALSSSKTFLESVSAGQVDQRFVDEYLRQQQLGSSSLRCACGAKLNGYEVDVIWINEAIRRAQSDDIRTKREGYVASSILLGDGSELSILLFNAILRDLESTNPLHVSLGMMAASEWMPFDLRDTLIPKVTKKLHSPLPLIRQRALVCLQSIWEDKPSLSLLVLNTLGDNEPCVVATAIQVLHVCLNNRENALGDLQSEVIDALINFQEQILDSKLGPHAVYKDINAPWTQIDNLSLIRKAMKTGVQDDQLASNVLDLAVRTMEETNLKPLLGLAIISECLQLMCSIKMVRDEAFRSKFKSSYQYYIQHLHQHSKQTHVRNCMLTTLEALLKSDWYGEVEVLVQNFWKYVRHNNRARDVIVLMGNEKNFKHINNELSKCLEHENNQANVHNIVNNIFSLTERFGSSDKLWHSSQLLKILKMIRIIGLEDRLKAFNLLKNVLKGHDAEDVREKLLTGLQETLRKNVTNSYTPVLIFVYCVSISDKDRYIGSSKRFEDGKGSEKKLQTRVEKILDILSDIRVDDNRTDDLEAQLIGEVHDALFTLAAKAKEQVDVQRVQQMLPKGVDADLRLLELRLVSSLLLKPDAISSKLCDQFASQLDSIVSDAAQKEGSSCYRPQKNIKQRLCARQRTISIVSERSMNHHNVERIFESDEKSEKHDAQQYWSLKGKVPINKSEENASPFPENDEPTEISVTEEETLEQLASVWD